jgi:CRP/FNR family transcriptional regulator, nitrogen oxide reductase regulator
MASPSAWVLPNVHCKFLDSMRLRDASAVLMAARPKRFDSKQTILRSGEIASRLFLLKSGQVKYFKSTLQGEEVLLGLLAPGDVFGLGTLLARPSKYLASAEAVNACEVLVWEHKSIRALARTYPQIAENALRIVLNYLRSYVERHVGLSTMNAEQRLASLVLDLSQRSSSTSPEGVEINATNEQLSAMTDMTAFTASRVLSKWHRKGAIIKKRGKIFVRVPEHLVAD